MAGYSWFTWYSGRIFGFNISRLPGSETGSCQGVDVRVVKMTINFDENFAILEIRGLTKTYDIGFSKVAAVDHINLVVKQGDFLSIMGPSGCGKSTLLYLIGGL